MADLNALYQALRNADAAGDTEGAKRLAQAPAEPPGCDLTQKGTQFHEVMYGD